MREAGYIFSSHIGYAVGENIAWATLGLATPQAIVAGWMSDAGHRANILDGEVQRHGIGVSPHPLASLAHGQPGAIYTQDFGRIITAVAPTSGRLARRSVDNLRAPTQRQGEANGYGSTRRQVGDRHRLGSRHRPRDGGAARLAGRAVS